MLELWGETGCELSWNGLLHLTQIFVLPKGRAFTYTTVHYQNMKRKLGFLGRERYLAWCYRGIGLLALLFAKRWPVLCTWVRGELRRGREGLYVMVRHQVSDPHAQISLNTPSWKKDWSHIRVKLLIITKLTSFMTRIWNHATYIIDIMHIWYDWVVQTLMNIEVYGRGGWGLQDILTT